LQKGDIAVLAGVRFTATPTMLTSSKAFAALHGLRNRYIWLTILIWEYCVAVLFEDCFAYSGFYWVRYIVKPVNQRRWKHIFLRRPRLYLLY